MGVVLDTNVWISALLSDGPPREVVRRLIAKKFVAYISVDLVDEFVDVLRRKLRYTDEQIKAHQEDVEQTTELVLPEGYERVVKHDPDNRVLECAAAGNADVIVTGDKKHLLPLRTFRGIRILTPQQFLDWLDATDR